VRVFAGAVCACLTFGFAEDGGHFSDDSIDDDDDDNDDDEAEGAVDSDTDTIIDETEGLPHCSSGLALGAVGPPRLRRALKDLRAASGRTALSALAVLQGFDPVELLHGPVWLPLSAALGMLLLRPDAGPPTALLLGRLCASGGAREVHALVGAALLALPLLDLAPPVSLGGHESTDLVAAAVRLLSLHAEVASHLPLVWLRFGERAMPGIVAAALQPLLRDDLATLSALCDPRASWLTR
jgi:hypothetical protein